MKNIFEKSIDLNSWDYNSAGLIRTPVRTFLGTFHSVEPKQKKKKIEQWSNGEVLVYYNSLQSGSMIFWSLSSQKTVKTFKFPPEGPSNPRQIKIFENKIFVLGFSRVFILSLRTGGGPVHGRSTRS